MKTAMIAMSGGVDSSVAAYLTQRAGYECMGATMRMFDNSILPEDMQSSCCSLEDVEDARSVAHRLGMRFYVFNFMDSFREKVMDDFVRCYECGQTPNPCIQCNRHLKFDAFLTRAQTLGCRYVVTGHYARILRDENSGRYLLYKAVDKTKDQSYFLYALTQQQLAHTLFPLGGMTKEEARVIAQKMGFINARKRDSQDICFVPGGDYVAFLQRYTGKTYPAGDFLDENGQVVGKHHGAIGYTRGQRKGLGLAMGAPVYVCSKDMEKNTVTVGPNESLFSTTLVAEDWNFFPFDRLEAPLKAKAKARSRMTEQPVTLYPEENGRVRVVFEQPQRALTTGQAIVIYDGDAVIGGGTITEIR